MPVKWDATTDQILLLKILETSSVSVDAKAISENWPAEHERPTPRAISERLVKIRSNAKAAGLATVSFNISKGSATASRSTPQKRGARGNNNTPKKTGGKKTGEKRKKGADTDTDTNDSEVSAFKANMHSEPPSKKAKTTRAAAKKSNFKGNGKALGSKSTVNDHKKEEADVKPVKEEDSDGAVNGNEGEAEEFLEEA